ncbi:TPA: AAA family ATPase [Enterobacter hormaechei]|nr:AAA family ATPase [Enterobacter hormaechei]EKS6435147.1 AAA family ATPase [Enterobacter hormaechei]EKS6440107.1 AAA family ATPase [Enterobacter hormaechei]EKS6445004.1 AAA family ATPase [Enterobacter hormaechei]EKS6449989.1 AAA family ATPase [Enterobacter hormaechei]
MELRLKNVTSYSKEIFTKIDLTHNINIIYGQNGTGKSTISNYFYDMKDASFKDCECTSIEHYRPFVYNTKFIEENFYNTNEQKGVFTLSKENAGIEIEINDNEHIKKSLTDQYKEKKRQREQLIENEKNAEIECIELVWKKTEKLRASSLRALMKGFLSSKKSFYDKLKALPPLPSIDLNTLANEYDELLRYSNEEMMELSLPSKDFLLPDEHDLLATPIVDTSNSYLSENIKKLQNLDWVKIGKELYLNNKTCPFCQEQTIDEKFIKAVESIFDTNFRQKIEQITAMRERLSALMSDQLTILQNEITTCSIVPHEEKEQLEALIKLSRSDADKNISLINEKIKNPSLIVSIRTDENIHNEIFNKITSYNSKIKDINKKVKDYKRSELVIQGKLWAGASDYCNEYLERFRKQKSRNKIEIETIDKELESIANDGRAISKKINELREGTSNIDSTIDSINKRLIGLGIDNFSIAKHTNNDNKYVIIRTDNPSSDSVYRSLSEGEKTLITFLYFIEYCKGKTDKTDSDNREPLIVIDDPISSLSHNYIYDIASMIHFDVIEAQPPKKTLILTHNLYFFHELVKLAPKSDKAFNKLYKIGRVSKNTHSLYTELDRSELQNEYQSLWQILKDAQQGNVNKIVIPNIMRNILEYYFSFVHKTDALHTELIKLANNAETESFRAFYRFINRGSHSDSINISDIGNISPDKYMEQFKLIFEKTGDKKHYYKMMKEEEENQENVGVTA